MKSIGAALPGRRSPSHRHKVSGLSLPKIKSARNDDAIRTGSTFRGPTKRSPAATLQNLSRDFARPVTESGPFAVKAALASFERGGAADVAHHEQAELAAEKKTDETLTRLAQSEVNQHNSASPRSENSPG